MENENALIPLRKWFKCQSNLELLRKDLEYCGP